MASAKPSLPAVEHLSPKLHPRALKGKALKGKAPLRDSFDGWEESHKFRAFGKSKTSDKLALRDGGERTLMTVASAPLMPVVSASKEGAPSPISKRVVKLAPSAFERDRASSWCPTLTSNHSGEGWDLNESENIANASGFRIPSSGFPMNLSSPKCSTGKSLGFPQNLSSPNNGQNRKGSKRGRQPNVADESPTLAMRKCVFQTSYKTDSKLKQLNNQVPGTRGKMPNHDFLLCRSILIDIYMTYPFLMGQNTEQFVETVISQDPSAPHLTRPLRALSMEDKDLIQEHSSIGYVNRLADRLQNGDYEDKETFLMEIRDAVVDELGKGHSNLYCAARSECVSLFDFAQMLKRQQTRALIR